MYPNVTIHPTAIIDNNVTIGKEVRCGPSLTSFPFQIGDNCNIGQNVVIGPTPRRNKCKIQNNVSVYKGVTLEDGVFCGPSMVFTNISIQERK
jgi:UDP-2-acetamido-3-amino-2,3-dideoxy-glucuronate N-acetyltransferase